MIEITQKIFDELWALASDQQESLNKNAFEDIAKVYIDFINAHISGESKSAHWVCDAAPGHGKTTILAYVLVRLAVEKKRAPAILVFNNKDTMKDFYKQLSELYLATVDEDFRDPDLVQYVDAENVKDVEGTLSRYLYICITQQRLRDLAVKYGNWSMYKDFDRGSAVKNQIKPRMIIIDEMPIFFDECIFDIGTDNNSVAWFDMLAKAANLLPEEKAFGRSFIMLLIATQFVTNKGMTTTSLRNQINDNEMWTRFDELFAKLSNRQANPVDWDTAKYKRWFTKLLDEEGVGCIDRHKDGQSILCAEKVDYVSLGNVLILDGTSKYTPSFYTDYTFKEILNRHDYQNRLYIHWRNLNTSSASRSKKDKGVQGAVSKDIANIRDRGIDIFPLVTKADIEEYKKNGVISDEQKLLYEDKGNSTEKKSNDPVLKRLALNIFNTTGKNDLRQYNSIAMMNMPIRDLQFYKLKAIGKFGTRVDISMADRDDIGWFKSTEVELLFKELVLAEFSQIIHRTSLRNIELSDPVHIYMYHNSKDWNNKLVDIFGVPKLHTTETRILNEKLYGLHEKCVNYAQQCVEYAKSRNIPFDNDVDFTPGMMDIKFKQWFNRHMKEQNEEAVIRRIFSEHGLEIYVFKTTTGERHIRLIG